VSREEVGRVSCLSGIGKGGVRGEARQVRGGPTSS